MRNDISFPCMEQPTRCYITVCNNNKNASVSALSCSRQKVLSITSPSNNNNNTKGKRNMMSTNEEWYLFPDDEEDPGIVRVVNRAHTLALVCPSNGKLTVRAITDNEYDINDDIFLWSLEKLQDEEDDTASSSSSLGCCVRLRSMATDFYLSHTITNHGSFVTCCAAAAAIQQSSPSTTWTENENPATATTFWNLEYCTGELCYIHHQPPLASTFMKEKSTSATQQRFLMCDNLARLRLTKVFGGWEVWRFLEAGNGTIRISSWTHQHMFLACDGQGRVMTTEDRWNDDTLWKIERASLEGVSIQSTKYKRYLTIQDSNGSLCALTAFPGSLATWQFTSAHQQKYYLSNIAQDKRLSLLKNNALKTSRHRRVCEVWELEHLEHGFVMVRSQRWGTFLKCDNQRLGVSEDPQDEAVLQTCVWRVIPSPITTGNDSGGGVCILSALEHGLALSCDSQTGDVMLVPQNETRSECWNLEPCMPDSLQQWQINLMVGGVIGAAVLGPIVAMGAAGMLGAEGAAVAASGAGTATGVAGATSAGAGGAVVGAGSLAVTEVAAATTAAGGGVAATAGTAAATTVAADGVVAFGLAEAGGAMVAGAALGASATGIMVAASRGVRVEGSPTSTATHGRSFCEWRSW